MAFNSCIHTSLAGKDVDVSEVSNKGNSREENHVYLKNPYPGRGLEMGRQKTLAKFSRETQIGKMSMHVKYNGRSTYKEG